LQSNQHLGHVETVSLSAPSRYGCKSLSWAPQADAASKLELTVARTRGDRGWCVP
jgi:hypothetical protein